MPRVISTPLQRGADRDALDKHGETPLIWASRRYRLSVVNVCFLLLAADADANI